jgi:hypothetical protein
MSEKRTVWHVCSGSYVDEDPYARESSWRAGKSKGGRKKKPVEAMPPSSTEPK